MSKEKLHPDQNFSIEYQNSPELYSFIEETVKQLQSVHEGKGKGIYYMFQTPLQGTFNYIGLNVNIGLLESDDVSINTNMYYSSPNDKYWNTSDQTTLLSEVQHILPRAESRIKKREFGSSVLLVDDLENHLRFTTNLNYENHTAEKKEENIAMKELARQFEQGEVECLLPDPSQRIMDFFPELGGYDNHTWILLGKADSLPYGSHLKWSDMSRKEDFNNIMTSYTTHTEKIMLAMTRARGKNLSGKWTIS